MTLRLFSSPLAVSYILWIVIFDLIIFVSGSDLAFQRFGSVIVAVAIFSLARSVLDARKHLDWANQELQWINEIKAEGHSEVEGVSSFEEKIGTIRAETEYELSVFEKLELGFLVFGTLQWGYGDIIHRLFWRSVA